MGYPCIYGGKLCDGCGECENQTEYRCPKCGSIIYEDIYLNEDDEIVGCDACIRRKEAWEFFDN